jgi:hypothetical protein
MKKYNTWELDDYNNDFTISDVDFDLELLDHGYNFGKHELDWDNLRVRIFVNGLRKGEK